MSRAGLKPKQRKLATTTNKTKLTANQWQNSPQQNQFMQNWLDPASPTFGNAHKSALKAGYAPHYAPQIASQATNNEWIRSYTKISRLELEHIEQKLINMINGKITRNDSNSPEDTRIRAIELLAKVTGKLNTNNNTTITIVQPILGGASVRGKVIDQDKVEQA